MYGLFILKLISTFETLLLIYNLFQKKLETIYQGFIVSDGCGSNEGRGENKRKSLRLNSTSRQPNLVLGSMNDLIRCTRTWELSFFSALSTSYLAVAKSVSQLRGFSQLNTCSFHQQKKEHKFSCFCLVFPLSHKTLSLNAKFVRRAHRYLEKLL